LKEIDAYPNTVMSTTRPTLPLATYSGTYSKMYGKVVVAEEIGRPVMRFLPSPSFVADPEHWHVRQMADQMAAVR
jgi:hypothetical protein